MAVRISKMTGKLKGIASINTNPLTNPFCQEMSKDEDSVCSKCYSLGMLKGFRKNCVPAFQRNSDTLSVELENHEVCRIKEELVRFHSHGELINSEHLANYLRICERNPDSRFVLFTKRIELVDGNVHPVPSNICLVYSNPYLDTIVDPPVGFHKSFNVVTTDEHKINCGGKSCVDCQQCWNREGCSIIIEKLK